MPRNLIVVVTTLLALAGCATPPRPATAAAQGQPGAAADVKPLRQKKVVCVNEAPLGSHIAEKRCRAIDEIDREREATQVELLRPKQGQGPTSN